MIFSKPKKKYSSYKRESYYIKALYKANKSKIDQIYDSMDRIKPVGGPSNEKLFVNMVKNRMIDKGTTAKRAAESLGRTELFKGGAEYRKENLRQGMKSFKVFDKFKEDAGIKRFQLSHLQYNKDEGGYTYSKKMGDGSVQTWLIDVTNSPKKIVYARLS